MYKKISISLLIFLMLSVSVTYAADLEDNNGVIFTSTQSSMSQGGFLFTTNTTGIGLINVTRNSSSNATNALLRFQNGTLIDNVTFSGNTATFSTIHNLTVGQGYRISSHSNGNFWINAFSNNITYPINNLHIQWLIGSTDESTNESNYGASILKLGYRIAEAEDLSVILNSPANGATLDDVTPSFNFTPMTTNASAAFQRATLYINGTARGDNSTVIINNTSQNITSNQTLTDGETYQWYINLTDDTHTIQSNIRTFTVDVDNITPLWRSQTSSDNCISIASNESIFLAAQGFDDTGLNYAVLATNETGVWQNKTAYSSPMSMDNVGNEWLWSVFTWHNSSITTEKKIDWRIYYNDTSGNQNVTDIGTFTVNSPTCALICSTPTI